MEYGTFVYAYEPFNIVVDPQHSNVVYVGLGGYAGQIYKTTDGGATWWVMDNGIPRDDGTYTDEVTALAIDPAQPSVLYAGVRKDGVYKTIDGGANWTPLNEGVPSYRDEYKEVTALAVDHAARQPARGHHRRRLLRFRGRQHVVPGQHGLR